MAEIFQQLQALLQQKVYEMLSIPPPELEKAHAFWHDNYCKSQRSFEATLCRILKPSTDVDGFFVVVVAALFRTYVAVANLDGLWTTHADGYPHNKDLWLASTSEGLHEIQVFKTDDKHIENLCVVPVSGWAMQPPELSDLVINQADRMSETGLTHWSGETPCPLVQVLADLMGLSPECYQQVIAS